VLVFHEKADGGAMGATAKAVIKLLVWADRKRWGLLFVKGTAGTVVFAHLFKRDDGIDDINDIRPQNEVVNKLFGNASGHDGDILASFPAPPHGGTELTGGEFLFDLGADLAHVGTALECGFEFTNDLAHFLDAAGTGVGNGLINQLGDVLIAQGLRQVGLQYCQLGGFVFDQIVAATLGKLLNGIPGLFDQLFHYRQGLTVVQANALIDFTALDAGPNHSDELKPRRVFVTHGLLEISLDSVFEIAHGFVVDGRCGQ